MSDSLAAACTTAFREIFKNQGLSKTTIDTIIRLVVRGVAQSG